MVKRVMVLDEAPEFSQGERVVAQLGPKGKQQGPKGGKSGPKGTAKSKEPGSILGSLGQFLPTFTTIRRTPTEATPIPNLAQ
jgi:hypothetical protein